MLLTKGLLLLFCPFLRALSKNFELSELVEKVHNESNSGTVHFIGVEEEFLSEFLKTHYMIPVLIATALSSSSEHIQFGNVILVVEVHQKYRQYPDVLEKLIANLFVRKFVIISTSDDINTMKQWFSYFADKKFTRIFGIVGKIPYAYLPYADNPIQQISNDEILPNAQKDLNGFEFRTTVQTDIPRTFWYHDSHGEKQIGGPYGLMFINFLRRHNATFKEVIVNNSTKLDITTVIKATINDEVDISMNVFCAIDYLDLSYPIKIEKYSIMVALNGYVDPHEYFERPFSLVVWIYIGLTMAYVTLMDVLLKLWTNSKVDVWKSFSQVYLTILRMPPERPIISAYSFHLQLAVFSFIMGNMYIIYFTSFLTVYLQVEQYDKIEDLITNNIRVMMPHYEWDMLNTSSLFQKGFDDIVDPVDYDSFFAQLYSMKNTSVAYSLGMEKLDFLIRLQSLYSKPLFRKASDVIRVYFLGFLLPFNSPFKEIFNNFIINLKQTGLIEKWESDVLSQVKKSGFKLSVHREVREDAMLNPLTLEHFRFAWNCLVVGLTASVIVFLAERVSGRKVKESKLCK